MITLFLFEVNERGNEAVFEVALNLTPAIQKRLSYGIRGEWSATVSRAHKLVRDHVSEQAEQT